MTSDVSYTAIATKSNTDQINISITSVAFRALSQRRLFTITIFVI